MEARVVEEITLFDIVIVLKNIALEDKGLFGDRDTLILLDLLFDL